MLRQESDPLRAAQARLDATYASWRGEAERLPSFSEYEQARREFLDFLARARAEVPE